MLNTSGLSRRWITKQKLQRMKIKYLVLLFQLVTIAALNTKAKDIENKIPHITNLTTKVALNMEVTVIENKIPDNTSFITTVEFNRLTKITFDT